MHFKFFSLSFLLFPLFFFLWFSLDCSCEKTVTVTRTSTSIISLIAIDGIFQKYALTFDNGNGYTFYQTDFSAMIIRSVTIVSPGDPSHTNCPTATSIVIPGTTHPINTAIPHDTTVRESDFMIILKNQMSSHPTDIVDSIITSFTFVTSNSLLSSLSTTTVITNNSSSIDNNHENIKIKENINNALERIIYQEDSK